VDSPHAVQVVLGEGEPGILRFILEAEGFHVVGQARGEAELQRVLDVTHPSVIVLDAGISATAALEARTRTDGAPLVVVWPNGVRTALAEERVDPGTVIQDLGAAVRRAATKMPFHDDMVVEIPDSPSLTRRAEVPATAPVWRPDEEDQVEELAGSARRPAHRARRRVLAVAGAWALALTASAALALGVPAVFEGLERDEAPRTPGATSPDPAPSPSETAGDGPARSFGGAGDEKDEKEKGSNGRGGGNVQHGRVNDQRSNSGRADDAHGNGDPGKDDEGGETDQGDDDRGGRNDQGDSDQSGGDHGENDQGENDEGNGDRGGGRSDQRGDQVNGEHGASGHGNGGGGEKPK
jgi:hypothetical protein